MNNQLSREEAFFHAAMKLASPAERDAFLDQACAGDAALRQRVEALLREAAQTRDFLEQPALGARGAGPAVGSLPPGGPADEGVHAPSEKPGDVISHYKLLEQIGEGGCGVVYMAEQTEPIRRRVALKVIKLGMDTKDVIARFEAERQALALMDHPNIAKVLDAGATATGRPFFVMELVRGIKITDYCDQNNLPTRARLELFMKVCQAIQHAHQKGIIHRDIKPSNILVTLHDGEPVPKVIDFGIAKATGQLRLTDKTLFTAFRQFIGTPAYMSPEQAEMTGLDIDTRSDIYSLGVLLYELLTGQTPFDAKELLAAGLDAMRRTIREQEPPRPSTRLSTMLDAERTTTARRRQTEPAKLVHSVRGDLDWIVMKCLEKDRTRRYVTANGLAVDIQRHLNNEPVWASPPSRLYRLEKMVSRNKGTVAAVSSVVVAVLLGLGLSTWLFLEEKAARDRAVTAEKMQDRLRREAEAAQLRAEADEKKAEMEAAKSQHVAKFLQDMLNGVKTSVALGRDTTLLREVVDRTAERVGKDLTNQPAVEAELRATLGGVYLDLSAYAQATSNYQRTLVLCQELHGHRSLEVASAQEDLGVALRSGDRLAEAEQMHQSCLEIRSALLGRRSAPAAAAICRLGGTFHAQGRLLEAEALLREALAIQQQVIGKDDPAIAGTLSELGSTLRRMSRNKEAVENGRQALAMTRRLSGDKSPEVIPKLISLAIAVTGAEGEQLLREVLAINESLGGKESPSTARALGELAWIRLAEHKLTEAEALLRQAVDLQRRLLPKDHADLAWSLSKLCIVLSAEGTKGKLAEAEAISREGLDSFRKSSGTNNLNFTGMLNNLGQILEREGKLDEAEEVFRQAWMIDKALPKQQSLVHWSAENLTMLLRKRGKLSELEALLRQELAKPADQPAGVVLLMERANFSARQAKWNEAIRDFSRVIELEPSNPSAWYLLSAALLGSGDSAAFNRHLINYQQRFGTTQDPSAARLLAKTILTAPPAQAWVETGAALAATAIRLGTNQSNPAYAQWVLGLAEYRQGHFTNAIVLMEQVLKAAGASLHRDAEADLVLAMALHKLGRSGDAQAALARGIQIADANRPPRDSGDLGPDWKDYWVFFEILREEAEGLIKPEPGKP